MVTRLALVVLVGLLVSAPAADAQVRGGTLRVGMDADNTTMDPHRSTAAVDRQVYNNVYGKLVDIDAKFGLVPQLAQSWEIRNAGLTYVFRLRRGVKFHDGSDFTAEIVKWNFERMRDPALASPRRSEIAPVKDVKVVDSHTVEITLSAPFAPFLSVLTDRAGMMVSRAAVEKFKDDFARNPVGTGPFRFVEWVKDDHLTLRRFDGYWEKGLPHLDEVVYRPIPDSSVRFTAIRTGQVDFMHQIAPKDVAPAKAERGLKVSEIPSLWWQGIHLNNQVAPFTSKALRQAMWYAVDRTVIQRVVYYGQGAVAWSPFPPSMWAQDRDFADWRRDVAKAKARLAEGGMPNGFAFTVKGWNQPTQVQELQIIQAQLKDIGVDMKIELLEFGKLLADLNGHNFAALRIGWSGRPDPDGNAHVFLHSKGGLNRVRYNNPKMDELLDQARAESDQGKRTGLYARVTRLAAEDAPYVWLHHDAEVKVWANAVKGFEHVSDGMIRLKGVWLEKR
ncbi:MAG: ABC transporter substrate-binding protein [Candidatus Rokubacteria bacterium]|nr:ABC transporter substrate-binding protein [Candidatus Rokubacteria bacterium]